MEEATNPKLTIHSTTNKIEAIRIVRAIQGMGLKEAKQLVESLPQTLEVPPDDAAASLHRLRQLGAEVEVHDVRLPDEATARASALDPSTPPKTLALLALHSDLQVQRAIVQNPNISPALLFAMGGMFPEELLQNPIIPLWLIEDPNLWSSYNEAQLSFLSHPKAPSAWLFTAAEHPRYQVRVLLARHPSLPIELFWRLAFDHSEIVRKALAQNPSILPLLEAFSAHEEPQRRAVAAWSEHSPPALVEVLSQDPAVLVRAAVASRAAHPLPLLASLLQDAAEAVRSSISMSSQVQAASDPEVSRALLLSLLPNNAPELRRAIFENPATPLEVLLLGSQRQPARLQAIAAKHPRFTPPMIEKLSRKRSLTHRILATLSPLATEAQLYHLADTDEPSLKAAFALAPCINEVLAERMALSPSTNRRCLAASCAALPQRCHSILAFDEEPSVREALTQQASLSPCLLSRLSRDPEVAVRQQVARHPGTQAEDSLLLLFDPNKLVRAQTPTQLTRLVAVSPSLPSAQIKRLFELHGKPLGRLMVLNPNLPISVFLQIRKPEHIYDPMTHPSRLFEHPRCDEFLRNEQTAKLVAAHHPAPMRLLRRHPKNLQIMLGVAQNRFTPQPRLARYARSPELSMRAAVAENPATPQRILWRLFEEPHLELQLALARNPKAPRALQERLASAADPRVCRSLAEGHHTPRDLRERLIEALNDPELRLSLEVDCALEKLFPPKKRSLAKLSPPSL